MERDEDIAAALPRAPMPAPARREAAIAEALRRFDGGQSPAEKPRAEAPAGWWSRPGRPYAGALAGAFLVALIGLPFVWTSFDRYASDPQSERAPAAESAGSDAMADADIADSGPPSADSADLAEQDAPGRSVGAGPSAAPDTSEAPVGRSEDPNADSAKPPSGDVVVTGTRIARPNLDSGSPVTVVGEEAIGVDDGDDDSAITVTGTRSRYAAPRRRGDWNACTIEDPARSLAACRKLADSAAKGASAAATARVAEGVSKAWQGDLDSAVGSFDRAIAIAPRSSAAYLNRALARRRLGDLDGALADLDRAVRFSPRAARYYYHRSLVLHQRGDHRRARADAQRAVELDPRYGVAVKGGQ